MRRAPAAAALRATVARVAVVVALARSAAACVHDATVVLCSVDTDAPAGASVSLRVSVRRGHVRVAEVLAADDWQRTFARARDGGPAGEGVALPASFGVTPAPGQRDGRATLVVEAHVVEPGRAPYVLRRLAHFAFVPNRTLQLQPIRLARSCADAATGCAGAPDACTWRDFCEERGYTCQQASFCADPTGRLEDAPRADASIDAAPGSCGGRDRPCCPGATPCESGSLCAFGRCLACGGAGQPCCVDDACARGLACAAGVCAACGASGQACCPSGTCNASLACLSGTCRACGTRGQPCCPGNRCDYADVRCIEGSCRRCGEIGEPCCANDACPLRRVCMGVDYMRTCRGCGSLGEPCCRGQTPLCDRGSCQNDVCRL